MTNSPSSETDRTMGWTLSTAWSNGRRAEVQTFSGAALPAAFGGNNTNSTGIVRTDIDANTTTVTDQAGKQRRSITNALGQLVRVDEPDATSGQLGSITAPNQPTSYAYDTLNNLTTVMQNGTTSAQCGGTVSTCAQTRSFVYDSLSRLKSAINPESGTINYGYDNNGNLTSKTDARGVKTDYIYDALNRVTNRNYSLVGSTPPNYQASPNVTYTYDTLPNAKGKLTKVASSVSTTEYMAFDILGRVTRSKQTTDGVEYGGGTDPTKWMTYTYNLSGALIEQQYPSGRVVRNTLDTDGSLQQVQSRHANDTFRNYANAFTYNAAGAVSAMRLGNGKWESTQFNSRLQPAQIALGGSAGNTNLLKLDYTYNTPNVADNNGNVLSQTITVPTAGANQGFTVTQNYTYDSLNRLKSAVENVTPNGGSAAQSWKQTYTFDRYGNRRFDVANTTTIPNGCAEAVCNPQIDPATNKLVGYQFDNAGNTKVDANGQTFTYDSENKQVEVRNASTVVLGQYSYNGDGQRIKKTVPSTGETTVFVYDASNKLVAEYSTIAESQATAKTSYLTNDYLGSPRITTDAVGHVISRRDFMPFGEEVARNNYGADSVRRKFTGYERDNESSLDFAEARYHSFVRGRLTSPDPENAGANEREPQSWNGYVYVVNNPINLTDPDGLTYLRRGDTIYWMDDAVYNKYKDTDEFKKMYADYQVVPYGTVVTLGEGQKGRYAGLDGQQIRLLPNHDFETINPPGVEPVTVFADHGPVELNPFQQVANGVEHQGAMWFWRKPIYGIGTAVMIFPAATPLAFGIGGGAGLTSLGVSNGPRLWLHGNFIRGVPGQHHLLSQLWNTGRIPPGLTRRAVEAYIYAIEGAYLARTDLTPAVVMEQLRRVEILKEALKQMSYP